VVGRIEIVRATFGTGRVQAPGIPRPVLGSGELDGRKAGTTVHEDDDVRIWHSGDDVLIISLKTKMHVIGPGVIAGFKKALAEAEKNFKGLVIWSADAAEGGAFSAGADLQSALPAFMPAAPKRRPDHPRTARHLHGDEIRERAGGGRGGWPGTGRRLRNGAARIEARGVDRVLHRPGGSGRGPDSCRRRPERSGSALTRKPRATTSCNS
jgi:hypothetical protein